MMPLRPKSDLTSQLVTRQSATPGSKSPVVPRHAVNGLSPVSANS